MDILDKVQNIFPEEKNIPADVMKNLPLHQTEYLVDGELRQWKGKMRDALSPVCVKTPSGTVQKIIGTYPLMTEKESMHALDAAVRAYDNGRGKWPTMSIGERIHCMLDFTARMKEKRSEVVNLIMWEIGKSRADAEKEFDRTVEYIVATVEALKDMDRAGSRFEIVEGIIAQIRRAPLGVTLCMGPFNYPLNETFTLLIPALIMGNTVVFKPPKLGVLLYQPLLSAFCDCFPKGVINTVYGEGAQVIPPLMQSGKIDVLGFIGSHRVVDGLKKQHPQLHRLRCVLGLGAKNAAIVLPDADLELTVKESVLGALSFNGQRCTALKIFFVHAKIADEFLKRMRDAVGKLTVGMPWDEKVNITPLPVPGKPEYFTQLVEEAKKSGARVVNDAGGAANKTFFYPALVYPVNDAMKLYHEEQFGPVVPVLSFDDMVKPVEYIVNSHFGQQVSIFGNNPDAIAELIDPFVNQVCRVNINSQCQRGPDTFPFTGRKGSAEGTLSVSDALRCFSIRTLVAAKENELNKAVFTRITREHKSNFLSTDFIL